MVFRQESAAVIVALFELNTPEFSMMLTVLPKSFQVMDKISLSVAFFSSALLHTKHHVKQRIPFVSSYLPRLLVAFFRY